MIVEQINRASSSSSVVWLEREDDRLHFRLVRVSLEKRGNWLVHKKKTTETILPISKIYSIIFSNPPKHYRAGKMVPDSIKFIITAQWSGLTGRLAYEDEKELAEAKVVQQR